jgi:hypothetical protein
LPVAESNNGFQFFEKAAAVAIHASRGDFAQRVKSAVIVPESANRANTSHAVFERAGACSTPI